MPHPLELAQAKAAEVLTCAARALGVDTPCSPKTVRFRPDGKGGELATPFPMMAGVDAKVLADAAPAEPLFARVFPSGRWIALDLSEQWLEQVRRWTPPERVLTAAAPPMPDFPARIDPALWRLDALAGIADPLTAARLDRGNPAWLVKRCIARAEKYSADAPDRRLVCESALLWAALDEADAGKIAAQLIALAARYHVAPAENALIRKALCAGWTALGLTTYNHDAESPIPHGNADRA